ncbi:13367_t:CDS:2 [Ambispora gerdemannii]|uniref:13367_t:CDS:1 n=1 Tax=Ambispora gerdemannii TaxID=144530 RepID=A0A9N8VP90_9GLOM|nr:13367_t:CDS:2 [Ambispora gerdemannii]
MQFPNFGVMLLPDYTEGQADLSTLEKSVLLSAPIILSVKSGEWVHQRILLIYGRAGVIDFPANCSITVSHHKNNFPSTCWPVYRTHFKCLVHLDPGQNDLIFTLNVPNFHYDRPLSTPFKINYIPLLQNPPLHLAILLSKDSKLVIDAPLEKQKTHEHELDSVKAKLRCAAYLWQAFTAEQMYRNGFGRRVFRLDEDWEQDTITNQNDSLRQTAKIHLIRTNYTREELLDPERAQQYHPPPGTPPTKKKDLFVIFLEALAEYGKPFDNDCYVAGLILDTYYDPKMKLIRGHAALGGGAGHVRLGIFGSHTTHAWPRYLEEVVECFQNSTKTDERILANDNGESETWWKCCNIGIGAMLHEVGHALTLPHSLSGIMSRGFNNLNRTFTVKEPDNITPITPSLENGAHWHRCDVVRFRFHPCFRLSSDPPKRPELKHFAPDFWLLKNSVLICCGTCDISLIEVHVNGSYVHHFEYVDGMSTGNIKLNVEKLKESINWRDGQTIRLHVIAQNQNENTIENFESFLKNHHIHLSTGMKAFKCGKVGLGGGQEFQTLFQKQITANSSRQRKQQSSNNQSAYLTKICINAGDFIDGITFCFSDKTSTRHGGQGGSTFEFELFEGEKIVEIKVRSGAWIDGLEIFMNSGRTSGWIGGTGGSLHLLKVPDAYDIIGIYGSSSWVMDSFGIIYAPADLSDIMSQLFINY